MDGSRLNKSSDATLTSKGGGGAPSRKGITTKTVTLTPLAIIPGQSNNKTKTFTTNIEHASNLLTPQMRNLMKLLIENIRA